MLVSQGSNIPEHVPQYKDTTGEEMGCLGQELAEQIVPEVRFPT